MLIPFLRKALRRASQRWGPIWQTRLKARRPYTGPLKRLKFEYLCSLCGNYYPQKQIQVDHIIPVGKFTTIEELPGFVQRLFCGSEGLRVLCLKCHRGAPKSVHQ